MAQEMEAFARLQSGPGICFDVLASTGHSVMLDMVEHEGDQHVGFSPMEMLLVALAGCTGISVLSILRKRQLEITGYEIRVHGKRAEQHPKVFTEVAVEHTFTGRNIAPEWVERALHLAETRYCGVEAMLGKTALITHTYRITEQA